MASAHHCCCDCKCSGCPDKPEPVKKKTEVVLRANLTCRTCQKKIEKALKSVKGVEAVDLNVGKHMITVKGTEDLKKEVCLKKAQKVGKAASLWPEEDLKRMKEEAEKKKKAEEEKKKKEEEEKKKKEEEEKKKKEEEEKKKKEEEEKKKKEEEEKKKKEEEEKKKKDDEENKKKKEEEDKKKASETKQPEVVVVYKYLDPPYYVNCPNHYCQQGCYCHGQYPNNNCAFM